MLRLWPRLTLALTLALVSCISVIRAQPYDNSQIRAFSNPPADCPAPCFMGIRPGVTTIDEALAILRDQKHILTVDFNSATQRIRFEWDSETGGYPSTIRAENGVVSAIFIPTRLPLRDYWLTFGAPDQAIGLASPSNISYVLRYDAQKIEVWFRQSFPRNQGLEYLLAAEITLVFLADAEDDIPVYSNPSLRDFLEGDTITRFG